MDLKEIRQLIKIGENSKISEFEMEEEGTKLRITKNSETGPVYVQSHPTVAPVMPAPSAPMPESAAEMPAAIPSEESTFPVIRQNF